jgi:glycosyltransferase involved in cell wall biosynthesis
VHKKNSKAKLILVGKDASDKISGSTSTWELMKNLFDKSALQQVQYLGSVSYYEIKNIIANATVCVFPTFAEAFPVSWLEAMAMEKAIVASNIGWATEVIDNNLNGYLVHPKNHLEFADRILNFIESTSLRAEFGRNARKKVLISFNSEIIAKKSIKFYKHYLKK